MRDVGKNPPWNSPPWRMDNIADEEMRLMEAILEVVDGEVRKRRVKNIGELSAQLRGMAFCSAMLRNPYLEEVEATMAEIREELMDEYCLRHGVE